METLPISLPLRTKQDVIDAHEKLNDTNIFHEMVTALVKVVQIVDEKMKLKRKIISDERRITLLANAIISRFDLTYYVIKGDQKHLVPAETYVNSMDRLPLGKCLNVLNLHEAAVKTGGYVKKISEPKKG